MNSLWQIWVVVEWLSGKWKPGFDSRLIGVDRDRTWRLSFSFTSSIVFFFLDTFTSSFQTISNRFWFLLTLFDCLCNHLITSEKNKTKTQKVWLSHWFILFGAYRPQSAFPAYKKSEKKSKIKLASSRYIVFSNQAEINQVKTDKTKISTQPNTSLRMQ